MAARRTSARARRGIAAYAAVLVLFALSALTVAFLRVGIAFNQSTQSRLDDERALLAAEAAVAESVAAMRAGGTGNVGREDAPAFYADGLLWVETDDVGNSLRRVRATAMVGSGRTSLEVLVFHYPPNFLTTALFSNQTLNVGASALIDSFDSVLGTYAAQVAASGGSFVGSGAVLQSNSDVQLSSAVDIHGDVHPGDDGVVAIPNSSDVSGSLQPSEEDRVLDPVVVPAIPIAGPQVVAGPLTIPPGDHGWTTFEVTSGIVTVQGPARLVLGDWTLRSNTTLVFDTSGGPVEVYVSGQATLASNSGIVTSGQTATDLALYFTGGPGQVVDLNSNAEFYGTIYAPQATVDISSNFEVFGAVAAELLILAANTQIHFDEALLDLVAGQEEFFLTSWSVVELPDVRYRVDRTDPFRLLGVDPAALPVPGDAHDLP